MSLLDRLFDNSTVPHRMQIPVRSFLEAITRETWGTHAAIVPLNGRIIITSGDIEINLDGVPPDIRLP